MQISLYKLFLINNHVVTKVVKTKLVICHIGNVTAIGSPALLRLHVVQYNAYSQTKELVNLAHPLCISLCKIVIDSNNMHTLAFQSVQVCRKCRYKCFTFTGFHFRNSSLMKDDTADDLDTVMLHSKNTLGCLAHCGKSLRKKIVDGRPFLQASFILSCFVSQFFIS